MGDKLRGESAEAAAALSRYHTVADNLRVKDVRVDDRAGRDRVVICHNPDTATRDAAVRDQIVARLSERIAGTDTLPARERAELAGRLNTKAALARFLRTTPNGLLRIDRGARTRREHRICAHVQLQWLALLLLRVAETTVGDTWRNIRNELLRELDQPVGHPSDRDIDVIAHN